MSEPTCVVLMASFNGMPYIKRQIETIFAQSEVAVRLIVRDDGSTDGTCEYLESLARKERLSWYGGGNLGPARGFLKLLRDAPDADYYAFSDQDDVWDQDKLKRAIDMLGDNDKAALYHCNSRLIDCDEHDMARLTFRNSRCRSYRNGDPLNQLCIASPMGCTEVFDRRLRDVVRSHGLPKPIVMHDMVLANLCVLLGYQVAFDELPHMGYRQHGSNVVGVTVDKHTAFLSAINSFVHRCDTTLAEQTGALLDAYGDCIPDGGKALGMRVAAMRYSFRARFSIAISTRLQFGDVKNSVLNRLQLALGRK